MDPVDDVRPKVSMAVLAKAISKIKKSAKRAYNRKNVVCEDHYFWVFRLAMLNPAYIANTVVMSPYINVFVEKNGNYYEITCQFGDIEWIVYKKSGSILKLHAELKSMKFGRRDLPSLPDFPIERKERQYDQSLRIQNYLERLLFNFTFTPLELDILDFINVSAHSFQLNYKPFELHVKAHHLIPKSRFRINLNGYNTVYAVVYPSAIVLYPNQWSNTILIVIEQSQEISIEQQHQSKLTKTTIVITNYFNQIHLKLNRGDAFLFLSHLKSCQETSLYNQYHRFDSFAPIRNGSVQFYIDAANYFSNLCDALELATKFIYICDWWLTPELYLKRPFIDHEKSRLDRVLTRAAERNVSVYILVYKEFNVALPNDSEHTKIYLSGLHRNIHVQRHPDHFASSGSMMWSHHEKCVVIDGLKAFIGGTDLCLGRWTTQAHKLIDVDDLLPGQDYNNIRIKDFAKVRSKWDTDNISRDEPRMPWHDIHSQIQGETILDIMFHFVQYWNHAKLNKTRRIDVPFLIPPLQKARLPVSTPYCTTQLVRSASPWSIGQTVEHGIYTAYLELITKSKSFIYIENQFFVSSTTAEAKPEDAVKNKIAMAIVNRIKKAHLLQQPFRVWILIPLVPGFPGDLETGNTSKLIVQFQMLTLAKEEQSIYTLLEESGINPLQYIRIYGLRNYGLKDIIGVNEQIYIHSKLMIVDDHQCILGSANLNDRSLLGNRDSELAVVIEFKEMEMVNQINPIKKLREDLWMEHLSVHITGDCISEEAWQLWAQISQQNTEIYMKVFRPYPCNSMPSFNELKEAGPFRKELTVEEIVLLKNGVVGHVVEYPIWFLKQEKYINDKMGIENFAPNDMFL